MSNPTMETLARREWCCSICSPVNSLGLSAKTVIAELSVSS